MDSETKQVLVSLCAVLRDSTEQAYHAHELAERVYVSCSHMVDGFQKCFESPFEPTVQHIKDSRAETLQRLDALIQQLQK